MLIKDLDTRPKSIKFIDKNIVKTFHNIDFKGVVNHLLPSAKKVKAKIENEAISN